MLAAAIFVFSCTQEKVWVNQTENTWYQLHEAQYKGDFLIENLAVNPAARQHSAGGISLKFGLELSTFNKILLHDETDLGYTSYLFSAKLFDAQGKPLTQSQKPNTNSGLLLQISQELVYRIGAYSLPEFFFPFQELPLPSGKQQVILELNGYGQKHGKKAETEPNLKIRIGVQFVQPRILAAKIGVDHFELNTEMADPHTFDFRMAGSGYPDLGWRLISGAETVHTSAVAKNKTAYSYAEASDWFLLAETDSVRLQFFDDDELSDNDLLATWIGTVNRLPERNTNPTSAVFPVKSLVRNAKVWVETKPIRHSSE